MFGLLEMERGAWGKISREDLYGLRVVRAETDPEGVLGSRRVLRAARGLKNSGAVRTLVFRGFSRWDLLRKMGLRPVDPGPLLRACSVPLAIRALERQGLAPDRSTVSLRGTRVCGDMRRTAVELAPKVRRLSVWAPSGGEELADWLRWEYGIPVLPPDEGAEAVLCFQPVGEAKERDGSGGGYGEEIGSREDAKPGEKGEEDETRDKTAGKISLESPQGKVLELYGLTPNLSGLTLAGEGLREEDRDSLPLLTALWEGGKLRGESLRIT